MKRDPVHSSNETIQRTYPDRRDFLIQSSAAAALAATVTTVSSSGHAASMLDALRQPLIDSPFLGHQWQTLNPGYWCIKNGTLRRRITNYGDRARRTGFPFHGMTHGFDYQTDYDPSLPPGIAWRPEQNLETSFTVEAEFTFQAARTSPAEGDDPKWKMYSDGFGLMGVAIGGNHLFESFHLIKNALLIGWTDDQRLSLILPPDKKGYVRQRNQLADVPVISQSAFDLAPGERCKLTVKVSPAEGNQSTIVATLTSGSKTATLETQVDQKNTRGYAGVSGRGLIDFEVNQFTAKNSVISDAVTKRNIGISDCHSCYPLGDTLTDKSGSWQVKFVALFASPGQKTEIRIATSPTPEGGWENVPVCGTAQIVDNKWRRNTAIITATLPENPADTAMYYTVWKDGVDVTADGRIGTDACGPGTGWVGDVPSTGKYVGRLPQLTAPYKVCGLSCHAINSGLQKRVGDQWKMDHKGWQVRDQPTAGAYQHLEDYDFQVMLWEDDVWYMELLMYPPSTDDAYKIVTMSICGPTSRWQMMRHWNVINPGDHDFGMDDVKGPEQIAMRNVEGLGQDRDYMRRNFQIVHHLVTGAEEVDPTINMKSWRAWKMPNRDFTLIILDSRAWRSSQDVDMWDDGGWEKFKSLYGRTDPTRSLLGEEQFGWLQEQLATDSSPLICLTGVSGMHTVWGGAKSKDGNLSETHPKRFHQRDRVTADYAGWVKAGADRVLELLGGRQGVVSVYGDVHNGCLMKNVEHRVVECSFGPIGRTGGRMVIPGFGPEMKDVDGRDVEVSALYHKKWGDPKLTPRAKGEPEYWNFLEMEFDPRPRDAKIGMRIRNLIDATSEAPRGGGEISTVASATGRKPLAKLPPIKTLPSADVRFADIEGHPILASRSDENGIVKINGLPDIPVGTRLLMTSFDGKQTESAVLTTIGP
jgi:hypothetical protein